MAAIETNDLAVFINELGEKGLSFNEIAELIPEQFKHLEIKDYSNIHIRIGIKGDSKTVFTIDKKA